MFSTLSKPVFSLRFSSRLRAFAAEGHYRHLLLVCLALPACLGLAGGQNPKGAAGALPPGETLTFRMKWKPSVLVPAMEVGELSVRFAGPAEFAGQNVLAVEALAVSAPGFRLAVRDHFLSYLDPGDFHSILTRALLSEGTEQRQQSIWYYPAPGWLWLKEWSLDRRQDGSTRVSRNELHWGVPAPLHDIAALVVAVRSNAANAQMPLSLWAGYLARIKRVTVTREGEERLDTIMGSLMTVKYNIRNLFGNISDPSDYFYVWATADQQRIPVKLTAKVRLGHVDGSLIRCERLSRSLWPEHPAWLAPVPDSIPDPAARRKMLITAPVESAPDMVLVPGGAFQSGAGSGPARQQGRTVRVSAFYLDRHEVSNREYERFIAATGRRAPDIRPFAYYRDKFKWKQDGYDEFARLAYPFRWRGGEVPPGRDDHPVVLVSWDDAAAYARWADKRLPTEAEWEMAARGGLAGADYPWGHEPDGTRSNVAETDFLDTVPVGSLAAGKNPLGLFDMCGNAGEWVADWFAEIPFRDGAVNPGGPGSGKRKVIRGGDWRHSIFDATVWIRGNDFPEQTYLNVGFRCARNAPG